MALTRKERAAAPRPPRAPGPGQGATATLACLEAGAQPFGSPGYHRRHLAHAPQLHAAATLLPTREHTVPFLAPSPGCPGAPPRRCPPRARRPSGASPPAGDVGAGAEGWGRGAASNTSCTLATDCRRPGSLAGLQHAALCSATGSHCPEWPPLTTNSFSTGRCSTTCCTRSFTTGRSSTCKGGKMARRGR